MDAGIASTILFVYPVMVALIMFLFFHEKVSLLTVFCILLALSGIGLLYKGEGGAKIRFFRDLGYFCVNSNRD
jgi:drug/metabolite transporter (DMT)-like permease